MLNKIKLRLKQETEEETALKQKYEQLRKKKARRCGGAQRSALRGVLLSPLCAAVLTRPGSAPAPRGAGGEGAGTSSQGGRRGCGRRGRRGAAPSHPRVP